jgi:hypothetical protein
MLRYEIQNVIHAAFYFYDLIYIFVSSYRSTTRPSEF